MVVYKLPLMQRLYFDRWQVIGPPGKEREMLIMATFREVVVKYRDQKRPPSHESRLSKLCGLVLSPDGSYVSYR